MRAVMRCIRQLGLQWCVGLGRSPNAQARSEDLTSSRVGRLNLMHKRGQVWCQGLTVADSFAKNESPEAVWLSLPQCAPRCVSQQAASREAQERDVAGRVLAPPCRSPQGTSGLKSGPSRKRFTKSAPVLSDTDPTVCTSSACDSSPGRDQGELS